MAKTLAERIASARSTDRVTATNLRELIAGGEVEIERLTAETFQATSDSLNFSLTEDDRETAASTAARAKRTACALATELAALRAKLEDKEQSESLRAAAAQKAEIIAERDALAERLRVVWPDIERAVVELLGAIRASDDRLRAARIFEPSAEAIARGCDGNFRNGASLIRRLTELKLPSFAEGTQLAWPIDVNVMQRSAIDSAEIYRRQIDAREKAEQRDAASWQLHLIKSTPAVKSYWTQILAKRGPNQPPEQVNYYAPLAAEARNGPEMRLWIKEGEATWLRDAGFVVEAVDQSEALPA